jgi:hypothetical protein
MATRRIMSTKMWKYLAIFILARISTVQAEGSCSLFLAETLDEQGRRTLGVFSAARIPAGDLVGFPDVVIPLVDLPVKNTDNLSKQWDGLVWNPVDAGGLNEGLDVKAAALGLGSLVRGNFERPNVILLQSESDSADLDRSKDPGAGAFSYYNGAGIIATRDINVGDEVFFPHHNSHWNLDPDDKSLLDEMAADEKVQELLSLLRDSVEPRSQGQARATLLSMLQTSSLHESRALREVLPPAVLKEKYLFEPKTPAWLETHGLCIDQIRQGRSQIAQAGHGAYATRALKEDSVIASTPLMHIQDKQVLHTMPGSEENSHPSWQLLLNYCFGHKQSSQLFCPIGPTVGLINHSPTPNAALRWSTHVTNLHRKEWFNLTAAKLGEKMELGLVLEYFPLRDIKVGEEITINYGAEWQEAWEEHVSAFETTVNVADSLYSSAADLNKISPEIIRTHEEQQSNPYPHSVLTSCYYEHRSYEAGEVDTSGEYAADGKVVKKRWELLDSGIPVYMYLRPCRILERYPEKHNPFANPHDPEDPIEFESQGDAYTVQVLNFDQMHDDQKVGHSEALIVEDVPRVAIAFSDFMYTSDMHLPNAFRHEMRMDDGLFPRRWRDLA